MPDAKLVSVPLGSHFKLPSKDRLENDSNRLYELSFIL